ncbi:RNA polymerase sigma-70 factor, ECF subfamily [Singulisphaera sp. GP187]|uniref:sigma-70 family RNA polymerase sigma factor n=1 Tax=Singulisphaera sp. GP187 TaxID=1882752 RepID=UPI0009283643|nr:sigma-70 family RNA polymerase sigma factor [Singulisphaera sp. GP187]SIN71335.1 RNA polymerase sigma-70 factor, ECF subfamily [Singulisphaera sp. GP187]
MPPRPVCTPETSTGVGLTSRSNPLALGDVRVATLETLVRDYQAGVRAFIRALGVNEAGVDDLAQETFLIAYRKLDEWDPSRDAGRWLRGIARHLAANERRKAGRRTRLLAGGLADFLIDRAEPEPDSATPTAEWLEALRSCLQELPEAGRELLLRRYAEGELAETMATRMQTRADTLRQRLLRLRLLVKGCVERKMGEMWS